MTSYLRNIKRAVSSYILIWFAFTCTGIIGCGDNSTASNESEEPADEVKYENGTYCADITYFNPNTGTRKTYILNVEVEDRELKKIYWSNGGWLDNSHFTPPNIDDDGTCSFTSDKGYRYTVEITGSECLTSNNVAVEGDDEPKEVMMTLEQCASSIQMTETELSDYEARFNTTRDKKITEEMCTLMLEYWQKRREMDGKKRAFDNMLDNGYIQKRYSVGSEDNVRCQMLIVKRKGNFYLLEVQGSRQASMGLMDFDHTINNWQEVKIMEDPSKLEWGVFYVRVVEESSEMTSLVDKMESICY